MNNSTHQIRSDTEVKMGGGHMIKCTRPSASFMQPTVAQAWEQG